MGLETIKRANEMQTRAFRKVGKRLVHKLATVGPSNVSLLCRPKDISKNDDTKSVNWNNVTCRRCLVRYDLCEEWEKK